MPAGPGRAETREYCLYGSGSVSSGTRCPLRMRRLRQRGAAFGVRGRCLPGIRRGRAVTTGSWLVLFVAGVAVSLAASWLLVSPLVRLGGRARLSEAWLGVGAALGADAAGVTGAGAPLAQGQGDVGAGGVVGS